MADANPQPASAKLFESVLYILDSALESQFREAAHTLLQEYGAIHAQNIPDANLVIAAAHDFEGKSAIKPEAEVVTRRWLEHCVKYNKRYPASYYSTDPKSTFSGHICAQSNLPDNDADAISAGIEALGGQWRYSLTKDVTHLFVLDPQGPKYETAMYHKDRLGIEILLPHWFDDCYKLQQLLPTDLYRFPNPKLFSLQTSLNLAGPDHSEETVLRRLARDADAERKALLYGTLIEADALTEPKERKIANLDLWSGKRICLSQDLALPEQRRSNSERRIISAGGTLVHDANDVDQIDVLVTKYRASDLYNKVKAANKTIGSLAWLYYVERVGKLTSPLDQLFHYPIPPTPIDGFDKFIISVTNYQAGSREYIKKMITTMGAKFTPTLSMENTHVIAADLNGVKVDRAHRWNIPVLNHTWLEDCFSTWSNLPASGHGQAQKYSTFPPGTNFMRILAQKSLAGLDLPENQTPIPLSEPTVKSSAAAPITRPVSATASIPTHPDEGAKVRVSAAQDNMEIDEAIVATGHPLDEMDVDPGVPAVDVSRSNKPKSGPITRPTRQIASPKISPTTKKSTSTTLPTTHDSIEIDNEPMSTTANRPVSRKVPRKQPTRNQDEVAPLPGPSKVKSTRSNPKPATSAPLSRTTSEKSPRKTVSTVNERAGNGQSSKTASQSPLKRNATHPQGAKVPVRANVVSSDDDDDEMPRLRSPVLPPPKSKKPTSKPVPPPDDEPEETSLSPDPLPIRSRRKAATTAAANLKGVMQDVRAYEQDLKTSQGDVRKMRMSGASTKEPSKKRPFNTEDDEEDEVVPPPSKGKGKQWGNDSDEEMSSSHPGPSKKPVPKAVKRAKTGNDASDRVSQRSTPSQNDIFVQLTKCEESFTNADWKALSKLGVKLASSTEGDYLIAPTLVRTTKMYGAIKNGIPVLTPDWLKKSLAANRLLDYRNFNLKDKEGEKKWSFSLREALEKGPKQKMWDGYTFFLTSKVGTDWNTMQTIIDLNGGQAVKNKVNLRDALADPKARLVSCPEDKNIWRPLLKSNPDIAIYTPEIVLTSALTQRLDWDAHRLRTEG